MADISKIKLPDGVTYNVKDANAISGSGTSGCIAKFNGTNTVTDGPAFGNSINFFLRNDGTWYYPLEPKAATSSDAEFPALFIGTDQTSGTTFTESGFSGSVVINPDHIETSPFGTNEYSYLKINDPDPTKPGIKIRSDGIINAPDGALSTGIVYATGTIYSNTGLYSDGIVSCLSMNVTDISSQYTITKSSGNWVLNSFSAYRTGNVIQLQLNFRGNGTAVSGGTTVFQGTITAGPVPVLMSSGMRASTNHNGIVAINTNGAITVSTSGDNWNLSTSSSLAIPVVFITA